MDEIDKWNDFVDTEGGSFFHYFEWKYVFEVNKRKFIPLIIEDENSHIIGIMPIIRLKNFIFPSIMSPPDGSGGFLLRRDLIEDDRLKAINNLISFINHNYSKSCSNFILKESVSLTNRYDTEPLPILIENKFMCKWNHNTQLPSLHILELMQGFEENIWHGLWRKHLRQEVKRAQKLGVSVIIDNELRYAEDFQEMLIDMYRRKGSIVPSKDEIDERLNRFKNKTKLYVALFNSKPIAAELCYYTRTTCYISKLSSSEIAYKMDAARLLDYKIIHDACNNGYKFVDFGSSTKESLASWKDSYEGRRLLNKIYERRYSTTRYIIERTIFYIYYCVIYNKFIWKNKNKLAEKVLRQLKDHAHMYS